jgi:hypothetical protein
MSCGDGNLFLSLLNPTQRNDKRKKSHLFPKHHAINTNKILQNIWEFLNLNTLPIIKINGVGGKWIIHEVEQW